MTAFDNEEKKLRSIQFLPCPVCQGQGVVLNTTKEVVVCPLCFQKNIQRSVWGWWNGQFHFWGKRIDALSIIEDRTKTTIRTFINMMFFLFGLAGLGLAAWEVFIQVTQQTWNWENILETRNFRSIIFWLSLATDSYVYYRLVRESERKNSIPRQPIRAIPQPEDTDFRKLLNSQEKNEPALNDISKYFDQESLSVVEEAWDMAHEYRQYQVTPTHLLNASLKTQDILNTFTRLDTDPKQLVGRISRALLKEARHQRIHFYPTLSFETQKILIDSYREAVLSRRDKVSVMDILTAISRSGSRADEILYDLEIEEEQVKNMASWIHFNHRFRSSWEVSRARAHRKPKGIMNRAMTARPTPLLDTISRDLTQAARTGALFPLINREKEMGGMLRILEQRTGNVLLVGDAGVGKSALVNGLAERMSEEDVPPILRDKRFVYLDIGALVGSGAGGMGGFEQRMLTVIHEVAKAGNVILFIDDIGYLVGVGSSGGKLDVASMLSNVMSEGLVKVVATATTEQYTRIIQNQSAFLRRFQRVKVEEMTDNAAIRVLEAHAGVIEGQHKVYFSYQAIAAAVKLSRRYIHDRYLPAKALDILEETAVYTRNTFGQDKAVTKEAVAHVITERTNITITKITEKEGQKLLNLEQKIHERIVGQDEAVRLAAQAIRRARTELRDPNRPIINLLFLGPTGVGKTELAKTIADVYFGAETRMIRQDMSEYQDRSQIARLIGAPPGNGNEQGTPGQLTDAVRQSPFSLVLLDELEKAHPEILNLFLQVLDDGRLTDGTGRTVDFTNTIIIATSNAGSQYIQDSVMHSVPIHDIKEHLINEELRNYFRPEFLNRFDGVVVFKPLDLEQVIAIAKLQLQKVAARLLQKGITFQASEPAIDELAKKGFDPKFGARPLRRVIEEHVDNALANFLLQGQLDRRDIAILEPGGNIRVQKAEVL